MNQNPEQKNYPGIINKLILLIIFLSITLGFCLLFLLNGVPDFLKLKISDKEKEKEAAEKVAEFNLLKNKELAAYEEKKNMWSPPVLTALDNNPLREQIMYGRELIMNTSAYFGPNGKVAHSSNGMNCQNCHLDGGTRVFGNNYSGVYSTYPKFRERSGSLENIFKRVNDCFERSLNGTALDTAGKEMLAIKEYIKWLGKDVPKGQKPKGAGITELPYLTRAADPEKGKIVYIATCKRCHEENGSGKLNVDGLSYQYPPLWGDHSYNMGAGLYRLSRFAGYVKSNMPQGATYDNPQLSDEEAWDVAAFVNSQPRPTKDFSKDWPKLTGKPIDHPFGPYADGFTEKQHKFGPYGEIADARKKPNKK